MPHITIRAVRPCLFFMLLFITGLQQQAWPDEYPSPPDADTPAVSPDGRKIVFSSNNITRKTTIWMANRDGSDARPLVNWAESVQTDPDWSQDGQYIVFSSDRDSQDRNIWRVNADGSNPIKLTSEGDNSYPKLSPDGTKILFTAKRAANRGLWYMSVDGSDQRPAGLPAEITSSPSWSPDGSALVYSKCAGIPKSGSLQDMECNLFTYRLDTGEIKQLTFGKADDSSPDWGSLGIVFTSNRNVADGILMVDDTGNNLRQIMTNNDLNLNPRWDHATDTIVFSKATAKANNIWSTDIQGNETQLTYFGFPNRPPVASAGVDQTVECAGQSGTSVTLNGSASSDPDGDSLSFAWTGPFGSAVGETSTVLLPLGTNPVTLSVNDGKGGSSTDTVSMNVRDTLPPVATAALVPASKVEKKEGTFRVAYSCSDACSASTTAIATLNGIAVTNNQLVKLEIDKETEDHVKKGLLYLEAPSFTLTTTCTDPSLNVGTTIAAPLFDKVKTNEDREEKKIDSK